MGKFNRGDKFSGGRRFNNDRGGRSDRSSMHAAICAECGKDCEVPFKPTGDKPVYCSTCFGQRDGSGGSSRFEKRPSDRSNFGEKQMFKAICDKCHQECEVPFKPSSDKPIYCNACFGKTERSGAKGGSVNSEQYKEQFRMLSEKLDKVIELLSTDSKSKKKAGDKKVVVKEITKVTKKKSTAPKKEAKKTVKKPVVKKKTATVKKAAKKTTTKKKK